MVDYTATTVIDVSGDMDIPPKMPGGSGFGPSSAPLSGDFSSSASSSFGNPPTDASTPAVLAAAGFAQSFLARKLWSGLQTVREIPIVKETTSTGWRNMRSWFDFCNWKRFRKPTFSKLISKDYYTGRLLRNIQHFHVNYICIFLILFVYCILTSPLLLIALFASGGAFYYANAKNTVRKLAIAGREITLFHQYCFIGALSLVAFYLIGAGSTFMAVISLSLFIMILHAALFTIEDDGNEYAFQLEEV